MPCHHFRALNVFALFFLLVFQGCVVMVKHENVPIETADGSTLSEEQVKEAIIKAGKGQGWIMREGKGGEILGKFQSSEYFIKVAIPHTNTSYSIVYVDSDGLRHRGDKIHKKYNEIVNELQFAIKARLVMTSYMAPSPPVEEVPSQAPLEPEPSPTIEVQAPAIEEPSPSAEVPPASPEETPTAIKVQAPPEEETSEATEVQAPQEPEGPSMDEFADWLRKVEQEEEMGTGTPSAYSP